MAGTVNFDPRKSDPQPGASRPPPLPAARGARGGALARVKAFLAIRRLRLADGARRLGGWIRRRRAVAAGAAAVVVAAGVLGALAATDRLPDVDLFGPASLADAREAARANPDDAAARRDLGHVLWDAKKRRAAVAAYGRALARDREVADARTIANLVAAFGGPVQRDAEALLVKHKLVAAQEPLEALVGSKRHAVRWGAVRTLDRIGKGTRRNWESAYIADLGSPDCDTRRAAVDKLGAIGTRRSVAALRAARAQDESTGGFLRGRCLGDRLESAEERILARR
jgi:hypothetical protein